MEQVIANLNKLLDKKVEYFSEIQNITLVQKSDIETNSAEKIEELVKQKQQIIDKVDSIDTAFKQQFNTLKISLGIESLEKADLVKYPSLGQLKSKVKIIMAYAEQIMKLENENNQKLNELLSSIRQELKQLKVGKKSLKAYDNPVINRDGIYIDKKK
jgi:molybdopterin converting factor small subunit